MSQGFMAVLVQAAQKMCHSEGSIELDFDQTIEFFQCRKIWGNVVSVHCEEGEIVQLDLPDFPLPERMETQESYEIEGVSIVPKFGYHSIVYFFLRRIGMNLIPS